MERPKLLDLFSGAGGCARGYQLAGFHVTGVDIAPQPRYAGDAFIQADALEFVAAHGHEFDVIHASPPCQGYSRMRHLPWLKSRDYPMLIDATREALEATDAIWVIENIDDAPLRSGITLCGLSFGLRLYRHRRFESNMLLLAPPHRRHREVIHPGSMLGSRYSKHSAGVAGVLPSAQEHPDDDPLTTASRAMGIDWMTADELAEAIPPAYTHWIGTQLLAALRSEDEAA